MQNLLVDFKNTIIIMTSNIGSRDIVEFDGADFEAMRKRVMDQLRHHFRPEFLNRVDDVVVFHRLEKSHLADIVRLQLDELRRRLTDRRIELTVTPAAVEALAAEGYDPVYGARPLKRAISRKLENPISKKIIAGELADDGAITVDYRSGEFVYHCAS